MVCSYLVLRYSVVSNKRVGLSVINPEGIISVEEGLFLLTQQGVPTDITAEGYVIGIERTIYYQCRVWGFSSHCWRLLSCITSTK